MNYIVGGYLLGLSIEDLRTKRLPMWILAIGCVGSCVYSVMTVGIAAAIIGGIPGAVLLIVSAVLPESLGIGDGVLAVIYGMLYGWSKTCIWLMLGFWAAAVVGLIFRLFKKEKRITIPFVPFLAVVHVGMCL